MIRKENETFPSNDGNLPKFGENDPQNVSCAYNVVVAIDDDGANHVLLQSTRGHNSWRLPGVHLAHGQDAKDVADKEFSNTGISLPYDTAVKAKSKDGENEITSFIRVIYGVPEIENEDTKWFDLETVADQAAGHTASIAKKTIERFHDVKSKMAEAQLLYEQGDYNQAITAWKLAEQDTPDPLQKAAAMRNWALTSSMNGLPSAGRDAVIIANSLFESLASTETIKSSEESDDDLIESSEEIAENPAESTVKAVENFAKLPEELELHERLAHARACGSVLLHAMIETEIRRGTGPTSHGEINAIRTHIRRAARGPNTEPNMDWAVNNDPDSIRQLAILNTLYSSKARGKIEALAVLSKTPRAAAYVLLANLIEPGQAPESRLDQLRRRLALKIASRSLY